MAKLILKNQATIATMIATKVNNLKAVMNSRKAIWDKIPSEKKAKWIKSGKDPIMTLAWNLYQYLDGFFGLEEIRNGKL